MRGRRRQARNAHGHRIHSSDLRRTRFFVLLTLLHMHETLLRSDSCIYGQWRLILHTLDEYAFDDWILRLAIYICVLV
jgi:hypothetical protein